MAAAPASSAEHFGLSAVCSATGKEQNPRMEKTNYLLGLYEKALPDFDSWEEKLESAAAGGFDWLEISVDESDKKLARLHSGPEQRAEIRNACANTGVQLRTMCLSGHRKYSLGSRSRLTRQRSMDIMKRAVDLSAELGIRHIQLAGYDVYYEQHGEDTEALFLQGLSEAAEYAASQGVIMGFETMETPFMDTVEKSMRYVQHVNSPDLGIYPDSGNLKNAAVVYGSDVVADLRLGQGHIVAAHLKETLPGVYRDMHFNTGGHTEYVPCIRELLRQGVRMFTGEFWYHGEENYKELISEASAFLRDRIALAEGK